MPQDAKRGGQVLNISRFCQYPGEAPIPLPYPPTGHRPGPSIALSVGAEPPHHFPYEHEKSARA